MVGSPVNEIALNFSSSKERSSEEFIASNFHPLNRFPDVNAYQ